MKTMQPINWWKAVLAFLLTFAGLYGVVLSRGPAGFYDSVVFSAPPASAPSLAWILVLALVVNALWWTVLLIPSRQPSSMPTT